MDELDLVYKGPPFKNIEINPAPYCDDYFQLDLDLESELFFELRKEHHIKPFRINESSKEELEGIKQYFNKMKDSFYFLFDKNDKLIGSILFYENYIQSLCVDKHYQRKGYGTQLAKFAVNKILSEGFSEVNLKVLGGNDPAMKLHLGLGFILNGK